MLETPIALTSCISKAVERLVEFMEDNRLLDHRQYGFRASFGTGTYLALLCQILDEAFKGEHVEPVSFDLAKAGHP